MGEAAMAAGADRAGHGWASIVFAASAVLTGGAVLRAAGRVFLGLGPRAPDAPEVGGETTEPRETIGHHRRRPPSMVVPPAVLLGLSLVSGMIPELGRAAAEGAVRLLDKASYAAWVLDGRAPSPLVVRGVAALAAPEVPIGEAVLHGVLVAGGAVALAALMLFRERFPAAVRRPAGKVWGMVRYLRAAHDGRIGDYVAWLVAGVAAFGLLCALGR
jgi:multicomponent Na+:H+ antiporter subunit D